MNHRIHKGSATKIQERIDAIAAFSTRKEVLKSNTLRLNAVSGSGGLGDQLLAELKHKKQIFDKWTPANSTDFL